MRVAALSDIHGNLPALEAVLAEVAHESFDLVVICGDVASGPLPVETLDHLMALPNARFLHGNADRSLVAGYDGTTKPRLAGPAADWCAAQLSKRHRDFLASFPDEVRLEVDGLGRILFCHGSPRGDEEMMTSATPEGRLREMTAGSDADVIVCGHTHMQFDRVVDGVRIVNPRRTDYDRESAAARIGKSSWPDAAGFARDNVVSVPGVAAAMEFFAKHGGP
jgi:putative phosphoesterase